jgi:hypothetical protein
MLYLMSFLQLEDYYVTTAHSTVTDAAMLRIKNSSDPPANEQPINVNSFGRVNKKLCRFIIDYVSLQVVFNNWYPFSTQVAPAPCAKMTPENVITAIKRNQMICVSLCLTFTNNLYSVFSENGSLGWEVPTIKQLCTTCVSYKKKWDNGIISSWEGYTANKDCLWIHHWVLLQFVHPSFSVPCKTDLNEKHPDGISVFKFKHESWTHKHESWTQFIRAMDDELVGNYFQVHNEYPRFWNCLAWYSDFACLLDCVFIIYV